MLTPRAARARAVLGYLLLHRNRLITVDQLIDRIWGDDPPATARDQVKTVVYQLRSQLRDNDRAVDDRLLVTHSGGYELRLVAATSQLDVARFDALVAGNAPGAAEDQQDAAAAIYEALALWRGTPLADIAAPYVESTRLELSQRRLLAVERLAGLEIARGQAWQVLPMLHELCRENPLHEGLWRNLIRALYQTGDVDAALAALQATRRAFTEELGIELSPELTQLHRAILQRDPGLVPQSRPREVTSAAPTAFGPLQLPGDIAEFTGRAHETAMIVGLLGTALPQTGVVRAVAIEGMAGVGKTRLAVHAAHQLAPAYPDGQYAIDLGGFREEAPPEDPGAVLGQLLTALGDSQALPTSLAARAALYRQRLAGRRALILLDNAADERQLAPLLPGNSDSAVLVTSRRSLVLDGVRRVALAELPDEEARVLFGRITGREEDCGELIEVCGYLPLAIALVAHRLVNRPQRTISEMVRRLRDQDGLLHEIAAGSRRIQTVFQSSYRDLPPSDQRGFRLLGLHPGDGFTIGSATALLGLPETDTERLIERLLDEHLVTHTGDDRYAMHDLLRAFARSQAVRHGGLQQDLARVLDWYLHCSYAAAAVVADHVRNDQLGAAIHAAPTPAFADYDQARAWLEAEYRAIADAVRIAYRYGFDDVAWLLPIAMLSWKGSLHHLADWDETINTALRAARRGGDKRAEARLLRVLGLNEHDTAMSVAHLQTAIVLSREAQHPSGEAYGYNNLGMVYGKAGNYQAAVEALKRALELYVEGADDLYRMTTLNNLALAYAGSGEHLRALEILNQLLAHRRASDDPVAVADTLNNIGEVQLALGRHDEAVATLSAAFDLFDRYHVHDTKPLNALVLGDALAAAGRTADARRMWRTGLTWALSADIARVPKFEARLRSELPGTRPPG